MRCRSNKPAKRGSSVWHKGKAEHPHDFSWPGGYGIFSIGFSQIAAVRETIAGQEEYHRKISFQDELRALLLRYDVAFDERYVWD